MKPALTAFLIMSSSLILSHTSFASALTVGGKASGACGANIYGEDGVEEAPGRQAIFKVLKIDGDTATVRRTGISGLFAGKETMSTCDLTPMGQNISPEKAAEKIQLASLGEKAQGEKVEAAKSKGSQEPAAASSTEAVQ